MSFGPESLRGAPAPGLSGLPGQIDYRLARNALVKEFKRGRLSRLDVCDAHPELLRAARNIGHPTAEQCPICDGRGHVRSKTTMAYEIMREVQRAARKQREDQIVVSCHPEVAKLLQGTEREALRLLMMKLNKSVTVRPQPQYHVEQYDLHGKWSRPELAQNDRGRGGGGRGGRGDRGRGGGGKPSEPVPAPAPAAPVVAAAEPKVGE